MKPLVFLIMLIFTRTAGAEIYNCNGEWTNKSCNDGATPAKLPGISRAQAGQNPAEQNETSLGAKTEFNEEVGFTRCRPDPKGVDIRIVDLKTVRQYSDKTRTTFTGSIKNFSSRSLLSPVYLEVKDSNDRRVLEKIAKIVLPNTPVAFTFTISPEAGNNMGQYGDHNFTLHYSPAFKCSTEKISSSAAVIGVKTGASIVGVGVQSKIAHVRAMKKSISAIEQEYKELSHQYHANRRRGTHHLLGDQNQLLNRLNHICHRIQKNEQLLRDDCKNLAQRITLLGR